MKVIKKIVPTLVAIMITISLAACNTNNTDTSKKTANETAQDNLFPKFTGTDFNNNTVDNTLFNKNEVTLLNFWFNGCSACVNEMPALEDLNKKLQKKGVGITAATSGNREHIETAFQRLGIGGYFQKIFTSSEVGVGKSNPLIYQEVAKFLGTELEETYVFEDVLYAIETAKKAGFHTVGIYDQYSARDTEKIKQEAEFYLESMEHASEILENL